MGCSPPCSSVRGISQQEHWTGLPFPPPGDLPYPRMESASPPLASGLFTNELPGKPQTAFFYLLYYLGIKTLLKLSQLTINIYEKKKKKKTFKTKIWPNCFIRQDQLYPLEKHFLEKTGNLLKSNTLIILRNICIWIIYQTK